MNRAVRRQQLLERLPKGGIGMEVGVWEGGFSEEILKVVQPRILHLVDPWSYQPEFGNTAFGKSKNETTMDEKYLLVAEKFRNDPRVAIHRRMSHEVLEEFDDASLDWIYLDGNHNFEVVKNDLALSRVKVKPGGMISGDDFLWKVDDGAPVRTAVRELRSELGNHAHRFSTMGQQWVLTLTAA